MTDNEKKNFTDKIIYKLLWFIWIVAFLLGIWQIYSNYSGQNRYLRIEAIQIDFDKQPAYTIGGVAPPKAENAAIASGFECSAGGNLESDILLPTKLIPLNIGRLEYNNGHPRLELNNCVDYNKDDDKLLNRVAYPKIFSGGDRILEKTIPYAILNKGLSIVYALKENQRLEIRLLPVGNKKYKLFITPRPNHLQYVFRDDVQQENRKFDFVYGKELSYKDLVECDRTDVVLFHYNSPLPQRKTISINKESASVDNQTIAGEYLLDGKIYLNYLPLRGFGILVTYIFINAVFLAFYFIPIYKEGRSRMSYREITKDCARGSTFKFLFIPILALAIFYNIGGILLSHYFFKFENNEYFFPTSNGLSGDWINYLTMGASLLLFFCFIPLRKIFVGEFLERVAKYGNSLSGRQIFVLLILLGIGLSFLWYFSDDQRALGVFPSHVVVRGLTISFYFFAGLFFVNRQGWFMLGTLVILFLLCISTEDTGFAFLSIGTFLFIVALNSKLLRRGKIFYFISPLIVVISVFYLYSYCSPNDYKTERFKLVYTNYNDLQSEDSSSIENANKETTDKQRIILHQAFTSNFWGYGANLRLPPEFKTVIWSDYVLLYSFLYFGGIGTLLLVGIPLLILIIYLIKIGKIFYHDLPDANKYSMERKVLSVVTGFILFSYATQVLYMLLAMFRVVPLTGQSIPFLSLSRFENFFIMVFITLTYIVIFAIEPKPREQKKKSSLRFDLLPDKEQRREGKKKRDDDFGYVALKEDFLDPFTALRFLGWSSLIVSVCLIGWQCNSAPPTYAADTRYAHKNTQKEKIFNLVLSKLSNGNADADGNVDIKNIAKNTDAKKLVGYFDEAINEADDRWMYKKVWDYWKDRSRKNAQIMQIELAKKYYGRESKLKPAEDTFIFEDTAPTVNKDKFLSRLSYQPKAGFQWKFNEQKLKVVRSDDEFYMNFDPGIGNPNTLAHLHPSETFSGGDVLLDEGSEIYTRKIDGEERLQFCKADVYGTLPLSTADTEKLQNGLTIDERLQALSFGAINSYCHSNGIMGGGIVVMDREGNVKALASYPSLSPNALPNDKFDFRVDNLNLRGGKKLYLFDGAPSVPLTAYPAASTWKMILSSAAVLVNNSECNRDLADNLVLSENLYFKNLMARMMNPNGALFRERLEDDFDIYFQGDEEPSAMFDTPWIPSFEQLKDNAGIRDRIAIGHNNCKVPLIALVRSLARIVTGKRVKPRIFRDTQPPEDIPGSGIFNSCYKIYLNQTSLGNGTATKLREATYGDLKIFPPDKRLYAKTGTYGETGKGVQQTYVVFGTENYFFGVILNEKPSAQKHAKNLAADFLPYIRAFAPQYLQ